MKYAFIVNPNSGHGKKARLFISEIRELMKKMVREKQDIA